MAMICPVVKALSSEARKIAVPTISSTVPKRPMGVLARSSLPRRESSRTRLRSVGKMAGGDGVDADAVGGPLDCKRTGESADGRFAGAVGGDLVKGDKGGERRDVDDPSLLLFQHGLAEDLARPERAIEVHVHYALPQLFGTIKGRDPFRYACGVDEDVDVSEGGDDGIVQVLQRGAIDDVGGDTERFAAACFETIGQGVDCPLRSRGGDDIGPCQRQTEGYGLPDAGGPTDNNGAFPCKIKHTSRWPFRTSIPCLLSH